MPINKYISTHLWMWLLIILCYCVIISYSFQATLSATVATKSHCCSLNHCHKQVSRNSQASFSYFSIHRVTTVPRTYTSSSRPVSIFRVYVSKKEESENNTTFLTNDSHDADNDNNDPLLFDEDMYRPKIPNDLRPPLLNWRRGSILFDEVKSNSHTEHDPSNSNRYYNGPQQNERYVQTVWNFCQTYLPQIVHGSPPIHPKSRNQQQKQIFTAYTTRTTTTSSDTSFSTSSNIENDGSEQHATAFLYNMIFVRIPTILIGFVLIYNVLSGHPLICDLGFYGGPTEIHPILVLGVLWMILR